VCIVRKLLRRFDAYTLVALNPIATRLRAGGHDRPVSPRAGRVEQRRRRRIAAELAEYRTPAERLELDLILSRHTAEQIREIEDLLPRRSS
jgi:hypothetical protein